MSGYRSVYVEVFECHISVRENLISVTGSILDVLDVRETVKRNSLVDFETANFPGEQGRQSGVVIRF